MSFRRTRATRPLPRAWQAPSLALQAQAIADRYDHHRRVQLERRIGIRHVGPRQAIRP